MKRRIDHKKVHDQPHNVKGQCLQALCEAGNRTHEMIDVDHKSPVVQDNHCWIRLRKTLDLFEVNLMREKSMKKTRFNIIAE